MTERAARAFAPGHVTLFFAPRRHEEPARAGSVGAGLTLADGVTVTVEPADGTRITLDGEPISVAAVEDVLSALDLTARVAAETPLELGTGFGVSGAMALATALAGNRIAGGARSENELITLAHRGEVAAGTGLGDVVAQARGGVPIRVAPGAPGHGALDGVPASADVEYASFGEISTSDVLAGDTGAIADAGEAALERLREDPTLGTLFGAGRRFARESGLLTPRLADVLADVEAAGGEASMAMLGETVVALGSGLSDAGYDARACEIHPPGATLLP